MRRFLLGFVAVLMLSASVLAADDIETLEKELQALEAELSKVLEEGVDLDARQDYVNRVLELREKIKALEADDSGAAFAEKGRIFKLVRIESDAEGQDGVKLNRGNTTFSREWNSIGKFVTAVNTESLGFERYPQTIKLGEPFTFEASMISQRDHNPGPCEWGQRYLHVSMDLHIWSRGPGVGVYVNKSVPYAIRDCKSNQSSLTVNVGDTVSGRMECTPGSVDDRADSHGVIYYSYHCKGSAIDGTAERNKAVDILFAWPVKKDESGDYVTDFSENEDPPQKEFRAEIGSSSVSDAVVLVYEPVFSKEPALEGTGTVVHEVAVNHSAQDGAQETEDAQATAETDDHDQDENQPEGAAQETVAQQATSEKDARRPHIEHWLANASPLGNTRRGYALKYDRWGRVSGATPTGTITLSGKPDNAGADNVDYVWARAGRLSSVNLCTLKDYVERKLAGQETVSCRMTIPTPVPDPVVDHRNAAGNAVPDLVGAPAARAKTQLTDMGVKIKWQAGSVPKNAAQAGTVEKQKPAAGTDLGKVYQVELWVYRGGNKTVSVPDVTGLSYADAAVKLKKSGLSAALGRTLPAPSTDKNGLVSYQAVRAGDQVAEGATVSLNVYGSAGKVRVPDVTGKPYDEAAAMLRELGLNPKRKPGPHANTKAQAGTVQTMSHQANQPVELGTDIAVTVYGIHKDTPLPDGLTKVESPAIVKSDPASAFGHPGSNGNGEGLNASPGSTASRATPRQFNCDPGISGLVVDNNSQIRGRGQGIVAADSIADSLYYCAYRIDGESYTLGVAFYTQQPKAGSYQAKSLVSTCKVDRNFAHGKAISIFPADAQPLNALSDRSKRLWEYRELFKFHADQVRPYAISCP